MLRFVNKLTTKIQKTMSSVELEESVANTNLMLTCRLCRNQCRK